MAKIKFTSSFLIGIFILLGSVVMLGVIFWLGANQFFKEKNYYVTYFDGSVQGLEQGSPVKYLGVPVGNVSEVNIAPNGRFIEVVMEIDPKMKITEDLRIKAEFSGIAGGKFLQIFKPDKGELVQDLKLDFKPKYTLINSAPSGIDEIATAAKEVVNNLLKIKYSEISSETIELLKNFNNLLKDENISLTIANAQFASKNLAILFSKLDTTQVVDNFIKTSYNISNSADELLSTVQALKNKVTNIELNTFLDKIYYDYDTTMSNIDKSVNRFSIRTEMMILSLNNLIEELRKTNIELRNSLKGISDDPSNIFLVYPPKKEE
ncbi:MAG: MlaD family protein [Candidatus Kapaibacteriota bacterium]